MKNFIINLLDIEEKDVEDMIFDYQGDKLYMTILFKQKYHQCPRCLRITQSIKDYSLKTLAHQVINHRLTFIQYNCRRYICPYCHKTFYEDSPFGKTYSSITNATLIFILEDLKHYTATYSHIAQRYGISPTTVTRLFDNHVQIPRHKMQRVICIDEFYFNRHSQYKYAFLIMGFKNNLIIDIVESRRQEKLNDYFFNISIDERRIVEYVCMDMYIPYKHIMTIYFPNASLCIDSFHVIKKITDSLNSLRKRICRRYRNNKESNEYKLLKYRYKLLLKSGDKINNTKYFFDRILGYTTTEVGVLECILSIDPSLRIAYNLKEDYRIFNEVKENDFNYETFYQIFETLIDSFLLSQIKEMKEAGKTLKNWKTEIMNSFQWFDGRRISNGCIEGKNSYIKKILSNANGMRNFKRTRNRIMYSQNKYDTYTISVNNKEMKTPGKSRGQYKK